MTLNDTLLAIAREKASIAIVSLAELHSIEVQQLNAANLLEVARKDEQNARTELASLLRMEQLPADLTLLAIPDELPLVNYSSEEVVKLALSSIPAPAGRAY